jgi:hypothetical protein
LVTVHFFREGPDRTSVRMYSLGMAGFCVLVRLFQSRPDAPAVRTRKSLSNFDRVCGGVRFSSLVVGYSQAPEITPHRKLLPTSPALTRSWSNLRARTSKSCFVARPTKVTTPHVANCHLGQREIGVRREAALPTIFPNVLRLVAQRLEAAQVQVQTSERVSLAFPHLPLAH